MNSSSLKSSLEPNDLDDRAAASATGSVTSFTPAPWYSVVNANRAYEVRGPGAVTIAVVFHTPGGRTEPNAALIAAAPAMFEALKGAIGALEFNLEYHRDLGNEDIAFAADKLSAAQAAIAKAQTPTTEGVS